MATTMRAAVYGAFSGPINIQEVPKPYAPAGGLLLRVKACGVCRSDYHGWKGLDSDIVQHGLPFTPGHELSGVVVKLGEGTTKFQVGDRVAVPFILSCGACRQCARSRPTICEAQAQPGFTFPGGFAEFVAIPRADRNCSLIPPKVSFLQAAALGCRMTTAYRAVMQQGRLKPGETLAVFGCGGLGLSAVMVALAAAENVRVLAVDPSEEACRKAVELGAWHVTNMFEPKLPKSPPDLVRTSQSMQQVSPSLVKMRFGAPGAVGEWSRLACHMARSPAYRWHASQGWRSRL